jgi:hypothetical protein
LPGISPADLGEQLAPVGVGYLPLTVDAPDEEQTLTLGGHDLGTALGVHDHLHRCYPLSGIVDGNAASLRHLRQKRLDMSPIILADSLAMVHCKTRPARLVNEAARVAVGCHCHQPGFTVG